MDRQKLEKKLSLTKEESSVFSIRLSKRAKRLIFKSSVQKGFEVVLPLNYDEKWVIEIIEKRKSKILDRIREVISERKELLPTYIELRALNSRLEVKYLAHSKDGYLHQDDRFITISPKAGDYFSVAELLQKWLHGVAKPYLTDSIACTSSSLGLKFNRLFIRGQRTRWGTCSAKRNISLNRNLLFMSEDLVDYVIRHELAHLKVLNHSAKFWTELEKILPDYERRRKDLKRLELQNVPVWASV